MSSEVRDRMRCESGTARRVCAATGGHAIPDLRKTGASDVDSLEAMRSSLGMCSDMRPLRSLGTARGCEHERRVWRAVIE